MHVNDAKEFLGIALMGFLGRNFPHNESEEPDKFDPRLKRYCDFVNDPVPHWVREKALHLLTLQNQLEDEMRLHELKLSPDEAIDLIVSKASEQIMGIVKRFKSKEVGRVAVYVDPPKIPK
jgi:hypothetical protein